MSETTDIMEAGVQESGSAEAVDHGGTRQTENTTPVSRDQVAEDADSSIVPFSAENETPSSSEEGANSPTENIATGMTSLEQNGSIEVNGQTYTLDHIRTMDDAAQLDPSVKNSQEFKDVMTALSATIEVDPSANGQEITYEEGEEISEIEEPTMNEDDDSLFEESTAPSVSVKGYDAMKQHITKKYGFKTGDDFGKFFDRVDEWRGSAQKAKETEMNYTNLRTFLEKAPAPLFDSLVALEKGEDWTAPLTNQPLKIDFNKDFETQDAFEMTRHYFPEEEIDKEDFDVDDPIVSKYIKLAERYYNEDKGKIEEQRVSYQRQAKDRADKFEQSVDISAKNLSKLPLTIKPQHISSVKSVMKKGGQGVLNLFLNENGSYKEDAAARLFHAMNYDKVTSEMQKSLSATIKAEKLKAESETTKKIVSRGSDRPNQRKYQAPDNVPAEIAEIASLGGKSKFKVEKVK